MTPNYIGLNGFIWWYGVVENRADPLKLGRCQVRIHGFHSEDKSLIPTEDLIWAHGAYGLDNLNVTPPKEGSIVQGYFIDGVAGQFPVMTHIIPGIPELTPEISSGFSDQRTDDELTDSPREPKDRTYNTDGSGVEVDEEDKAKRNPFIVKEPTTSRLSRNEKIEETFIQVRKDSVVTGVETASGGTWDEPETKYAAKYPWNRVIHTESGHIIELDDTVGAERVHIAHRSGSFLEMFPDGDVVVKHGKHKYQIVMADDHLYVMGDQKITIQGDAEIYTKGDHTLKVDGDLTVEVGGDMTATVGGDVTASIEGDLTGTVAGDTNITIAGSLDVTATSSITFTTTGIFHITAAAVTTTLI